jgi:hypothetical protein
MRSVPALPKLPHCDLLLQHPSLTQPAVDGGLLLVRELDERLGLSLDRQSGTKIGSPTIQPPISLLPVDAPQRPDGAWSD